jgi:pimeloyl-ACP methyl ester carboxylesterase
MKIILTFYLCLFSIILNAQTSSEVSIDVDDGKLFGTLTVVDNQDQSPVVLIIAGSGPTDRNMGKGMSYKMLSDSLVKYNISTLRVDKRSAGKSFQHLTNLENTMFEDFVDDAKSWVQFLKNDQRFSEVIILGHSQGSLIAFLASQDSAVDKCISLAGVGEKADLVIRKQIYNPPINKFFFGVVIDTLFEKISRSEFVETDSIPELFRGMFRREMQPFLLSWMTYDPQEEIQRVDIPILIVQGGMDFQVQMDQYEFLKNAMPSADTLLIQNMNHAMKFADTLDKMKNAKNYEDPTVGLVAEFVPKLVEFILR